MFKSAVPDAISHNYEYILYARLQQVIENFTHTAHGSPIWSFPAICVAFCTLTRPCRAECNVLGVNFIAFCTLATR
jgi:hypothetical protein